MVLVDGFSKKLIMPGSFNEDWRLLLDTVAIGTSWISLILRLIVPNWFKEKMVENRVLYDMEPVCRWSSSCCTPWMLFRV